METGGGPRAVRRAGARRGLPGAPPNVPSNVPGNVPGNVLADILLGALLAVALLGTLIALAGSWGGTSWLLDLPAGLTVGILALRRHYHPTATATTTTTAVAAATVAVVSIAVARLAGYPHEPGPATVLGLAVLTASAVRRQEPRRAAVAAGCALTVVVAAALTSRPYGSGLDVITVLAALGWLGAVAAGLALRLRDAQRRAVLDEVRRDERLDLARELHDLAAHHLTGLVLQAQAARIVARRDPAELDESLAGIETAGTGALDAMRRVVGLLRDPSDAAPMLPGPPSPAELVRTFAARPGAPIVRASLVDAELPPAVAGTVHRIVYSHCTSQLPVPRLLEESPSSWIKVCLGWAGVVNLSDPRRTVGS